MKTSTFLVACLLLSAVVKAQSNFPKLGLQRFASGIVAPMDIANCGDSRIFVAERLGKIWILDSTGTKMSEPFLDITDKVFTVYPNDYDERGLLGMAFHPNYPDSPYLYVNYTGFDSNSHIARFTVNPSDPNKALPHSQLMLLTVQQPEEIDFVNHKAGCLKFGPDGFLYATFGDGGSGGDPFNNAQNPRTLLGKIIRINVNKPDPARGKKYSVPSTNPFVNTPKFKDEIWATGLRNPWRFSFDSKTGALWLPDVGQDKWEEINVIGRTEAGGKNFGWSCYEGTHTYKFDSCDYNGMPYTFPVVEYEHSAVNCASITGGFVYRGSKYPKMQGKYFYTDYCTGKFSAVLKTSQTWLNLLMLESTPYVFVTFGEDNKGELYVADNVNGIIYTLVDSSDLGKSPIVAENKNDLIKSLSVKLSPNPNHGQFNVEVTAMQNENYKISVTNLFGRELISETKSAIKGFNRWPFASVQLQKGIYVLHIQTTHGSVSQKFVVE